MPIWISAEFSVETLQARRERHNILNIMQGKNLQPRILCQAGSSFRTEGEITIFPCEQKLKEFITANLSLQEMLKGILQVERKGQN